MTMPRLGGEQEDGDSSHTSIHEFPLQPLHETVDSSSSDVVVNLQQQLQHQQYDRSLRGPTRIWLRPLPPPSTTLLYRYSAGLACWCCLWACYLALPRGWRQAYMRAERKRYARHASLPQSTTTTTHITRGRVERRMPATPSPQRRRRAMEARTLPFDDPVRRDRLLQGWLAANEAHNSNVRQRNNPPDIHRTLQTANTQDTDSSFGRFLDQSYQSAPRHASVSPPRPSVTTANNARKVTPSPRASSRQHSIYSTQEEEESLRLHPGIERMPDPAIVQDTMYRLQNKGIRLMAHGVQSEPRRIWLRVCHFPPSRRNDTSISDSSSSSDDDSRSDLGPLAPTIVWQTEIAHPTANGTRMVWMRGPEHPLAVVNIVYIDVGKQTAALRQTSDTRVPPATCCSLLTHQGSLDVQAHSRLERDAIVTCLCHVLDAVHRPDWRAVYEESLTVSDMSPSISHFSQTTSDLFHHRLSSVEI
jgi:hypothetical protein